MSQSCAAPVSLSTRLSAIDAVALADRLKALADPVRLQLVSYILDQESGEACTCELAPLVELSEPTVSHHLKKLEANGLVSKERRGMNVYYRVVPQSIGEITAALNAACC
jgi:ArsR family transcriptional regulator